MYLHNNGYHKHKTQNRFGYSKGCGLFWDLHLLLHFWYADPYVSISGSDLDEIYVIVFCVSQKHIENRIFAIHWPGNHYGPYTLYTSTLGPQLVVTRVPSHVNHWAKERDIQVTGVSANTALFTLQAYRVEAENGRHFADDIFMYISLNKYLGILTTISLKYVPWCLINNMAALVKIKAWHRRGEKPSSEPIMV